MNTDNITLSQQVQNLALTVEQLKQELAELKKSSHLSADDIIKIQDAAFNRMQRPVKGLR
ncbi:hypothetical protein [Scytonema sp. NUACC26]|uniref:hypothetical protein n=1 Tax=Scytonema sp. NUACC26 TaxID=3140176 RepID=UPI0038B25633